MASHLNLSPEIESCPPTDSYKITESSSWSTSSNTQLTQAITMLDQYAQTVNGFTVLLTKYEQRFTATQ